MIAGRQMVSALVRGARFEYVAGEWSPGLSLVRRP